MLKKGKYRHYKGQDYEVLGVVLHTETQQPMVHYRALYEVESYDVSVFGETLEFVRPLSLWLEKAELNGKKVERFSQITD